jgi:deoxyadenosine/deoxycytidine kinase
MSSSSSRKFPGERPVVVVVSGIISSGKSTLVKVLAKRLLDEGYRVASVPEPVKKWKDSGLLEAYYADVSRNGYLFQTVAFTDRVKANINTYQKHRGEVDVYLLERSCVDDRIFMKMLYDEKLITDLEYSSYLEWASLWQAVMPYIPDVFVYLKPSMEECMKRIKDRARPGEEGVSESYQIKLQKEHDLFFGEGALSASGTIIRTSGGAPLVDHGRPLENQSGLGRTPSEVVESIVTVDDLFIPCFILQNDSNFRDSLEHQKEITTIFENIITKIRVKRGEEQP